MVPGFVVLDNLRGAQAGSDYTDAASMYSACLVMFVQFRRLLCRSGFG